MDESHSPLLVEVDPSDNLNDLLASRVRATPDKTLVERWVGGAWVPTTAREYDAHIVAVAKGLVAKGVAPGDRVGIMSRTRYEWSLLDWSIWAAGAVPVPLYETSSAKQVQWILTDADVKHVVVETSAHAATVEQVRRKCPSLGEVLVLDEGGIDAIVAMWDSDRGDDPEFDFEVLIEDDRLAIIKGHVNYPEGKHYSNIWEVWFAPDGRAQKFVEWWMLPHKRAAG